MSRTSSLPPRVTTRQRARASTPAGLTRLLATLLALAACVTPTPAAAGDVAGEGRTGFEVRLSRGGVQHLQVVYVERSRLLRMLGGLGPLQDLGAGGAMTWRFEPTAGGTRMTWTYRVAGLEPAAAAALAGVVTGVVTQQADRLAKHLGHEPR